MRISDWSSDVCSSDLTDIPAPVGPDLADRNTEILGLGQDRYDRFTLPVTIDGAGPFHLMIDTGSQATALTEGIHSRSAARRVGKACVSTCRSRCSPYN